MLLSLYDMYDELVYSAKKYVVGIGIATEKGKHPFHGIAKPKSTRRELPSIVLLPYY